jgi:hypothetical protein
MQSITSAIQVLGRTHTVPGKSKLKAAGPKLNVGPTNTSQCACMAQAMDSLVMASVPIKPVGPCCSVEPMGKTMPWDLVK